MALVSINNDFLFFQLLNHDLHELVDDLHWRIGIERVGGAGPDQLSIRLGSRIEVGLHLRDSFFDKVAGRIDQGIDGSVVTGECSVITIWAVDLFLDIGGLLFCF